MKYRKMGSVGWDVSALGFGCMRFPTYEKDGKKLIEETEATEMLHYAIDNGVNYVDTAWPYHGGASESFVGKALQGGYREKVYLVTKAPVWEYKTAEDFNRILDTQLERLQTDHIDLYLLHALNDKWWNKVEEFGILAKMEEARSDGKIHKIGFSFHGSADTFRKIIDSYTWDACQIQFNYLDTHYQASIKGLEYAASKGIAVIVMEPLRGGKLAQTNEKMDDIIQKAPTQRNVVDWALQYVWHQPGVSLLLSGMSALDHVRENVDYANKSGINHLSEAELQIIGQLKAEVESKLSNKCTFCKYCLPCPEGVAIPNNLQILNTIAWEGMNPSFENWYKGMSETPEQLAEKPNSGRASLCVECQECLEKCPQNIDIPGELKKLSAIFDEGRPAEEVLGIPK